VAPVEVLDEADLQAAIALLSAVVPRIKADLSFVPV